MLCRHQFIQEKNGTIDELITETYCSVYNVNKLMLNELSVSKDISVTYFQVRFLLIHGNRQVSDFGR